jgi:hypothetical protein
VLFTTIQLDNDSSVHDDSGVKPSGCHHYGKMEIQELLDYIYEENSEGVKVEVKVKVTIKQRKKTQAGEEEGVGSKADIARI